jgi:transposase
MNKNTKFIGIDISKKVFDIWSDEIGHKQFKNSNEGFAKFVQLLEKNSWCVMEYTASYYQNLAIYLYENGVPISIINPLVLKRFIQMKLQHNKTDKSDAKMIVQYANEQKVYRWEPAPKYIEECKDLHTAIAIYFKQSTALKNKLQSYLDKGVKGKLISSMKRQIKQLKQEIKLLEYEIEIRIKENEPDLLANLTSIKGIGQKTAMMLIASTNGFRSFENAKQVSAFFGLSPTETSSGASVRGKSRITKKGNPLVRNHLFMCSFTASKNNTQCKNLYDRIVNKGKSKKLALIAVTNKLLKQMFAIAKSGVPYDPDFKAVLVSQ